MAIFDWLIILAYFVTLLTIGIKTRKMVHNMDDFSIAGGKIIWPSVFVTLAASIIGGGASIGTSGQVFANGFGFFFATLGFTVQFILLGVFVTPKIREYKNAHSIGDIMGIHYGKSAKIISGVLSVLFCAGILGTQVLALGTVINSITGISIAISITVAVGAVVVYSTFGGLMTVVQTDAFQFLILGVILPLILLIGLFHLGGAENLIASIPETHQSIFGAMTGTVIFSLFVTLMLGEALAPPYVQRIFAAKDPNSSRKAYVATGLFFVLVTFITSSIGLVALGLFPDIEADQALPHLMKTILPMGLTGLGIATLLAIILSTADAYLNSTTTSFIRDLYIPFINPQASQRKQLFISRMTNIIVGILAIIFALNMPSIIDALVYVYSLWAPTMIAPLIYAIVSKRKNKYIGTTSMIVGALVTAIWIWVLHEPFGISGVIAGIAANVITILLLHFFTTGDDVNLRAEENVG